MSNLLRTLAKVAVGVAAAKGIGNMMSQKACRQRGFGRRTGPGSAGERRRCPTRDWRPADLRPRRQGPGGRWGLAAYSNSSLLPPLQVLGPAPGATAPASGGGLDALIRSLGDAVTHPGTTSKADAGGSSADVPNPSFQKLGEPKVAPTPQQDAAAGLMLRAMLQAAKCDGRSTRGRRRSSSRCSANASPDEMAFVNRELASPVDIQGLVKQVPKGAEKQIYAVSVMAVDLDSQKEAEYLGGLASGLGLGPAEVNAMHAQFGIPALYS